MPTTPRGRGFQSAFTVGGVRYREQFETLAEAENWETEVRLALRRGLETPAPRQKAAASRLTTLGELFDYTVTHTWAGQRSEIDLVRNGRYAVEHFGRDTLASKVGRNEIDRWVLDLKARRNSGGTINRKLAALSRILRTGVELRTVSSKPTIPRQREAEGRERYLEQAEVAAIVRTLRLWSKPDFADLVEFLVATGCRVGEALSLTWGDAKAAHITVTGDKAKSSKTRHVPLTDRAAAILAERRVTEPLGPFGSVTYTSFRPAFEKAVGHLRLEDVVIHTLRHTTASWLAIRGVDIYRIMQFMGHSNVKTTQRYAKLSPSSLDVLADVIGGYGDNVVQLRKEVA